VPDGQLLLEREAELERLDLALAAATTASGRLVVVEGPAGIGKTALLREVQRRARGDGMRVLSAQGAPLEQEFGLGVVRQLFESCVAAAPPDERRRLLAGAAALAAPVVAPDEADPTASVHPEAIVHGLYWVTANLAELAPVLIVVDDAHWADAASLVFLSYLARRLEGLPVLVVSMIGSGVAGSLDSLPDALATVCRMLPLTPVLDLVRLGWLGTTGADAPRDFTGVLVEARQPAVIILLWLAIGVSAIRRWFRWDTRH